MGKEKTSKHSNACKRRPVEQVEYKRENMEFFMTNGNATSETIKDFADRHLDFVLKNKKVTSLDVYCAVKGVTPGTYCDWVRDNEYLKEKNEILKAILAIRREKKMEKANAFATLKHTQYQYSKRWNDADKRNADLNKNLANEGPGFVIIEKAAPTKEVPEKGK